MSSHYLDCLFWLTNRNVLCILLLLLIICFHWSWLWSSSLPVWIYHFIIITSLSFFFFFSHFETTFIPQLYSYSLEINFFICLFFSCHSFASCDLSFYFFTPFIALCLWVEHCLTSSSGFLPTYNFLGFDSIVTSEGVCGFYWKQSTWPVAYLMQKRKLNDSRMNWYLLLMTEVEVSKMYQYLRLSGRYIYQTNEPHNTSAGKS